MNVLLVDDDAYIRTLVPMALPGDTVRDAPRLADARCLIESFAPDVAIVDVKLPDGDGIDFVRDLRSSGHRFPILVFTSGFCEKERKNVLAAGADEYLFKTEELRDLRALRARVVRTTGLPVDSRRTRREFLAYRAAAGETGELDRPDVEALVGPAPKDPKSTHRRRRRPEPWF
jgi:DNA-binding response OmpR family regulator